MVIKEKLSAKTFKKHDKKKDGFLSKLIEREKTEKAK